MELLINTIEKESAYADEFEQYLTFVLGGKVYGLSILNIREIIEYGDVTEVPMMPDFVSGVINLRGRVVPVVELAQRFCGKATEYTKRTSIIILEIENDGVSIEMGVTVDMVNEVLDVNLSEIEPAPDLGGNIKTKFISGMAKIDGKLLILLNIENILSVDEVSIVGNIQSSITH